MDYVLMGQRIKQARKAQHLTQAQLAQLVGLSSAFLGHIERGTRKASLETVKALCKALNVSSDYLIGLSDESAIRAILGDIEPLELEAGLKLLQKITVKI